VVLMSAFNQASTSHFKLRRFTLHFHCENVKQKNWEYTMITIECKFTASKSTIKLFYLKNFLLVVRNTTVRSLLIVLRLCGRMLVVENRDKIIQSFSTKTSDT